MEGVSLCKKKPIFIAKYETDDGRDRLDLGTGAMTLFSRCKRKDGHVGMSGGINRCVTANIETLLK